MINIPFLFVRQTHARVNPALLRGLLLAFMSASHPLVAQAPVSASRPAPSLGSAGLPGTNQVIPNAIVTWGYWGVQARTCVGNTKSTRCTVIVGNGDAAARSICLSSAILNFSPTDSVRVFLRSADPANGLIAQKASPSITAPECVTVAPHGVQQLTAFVSPELQQKPVTISVSFEERVQPGSAGLFRARARIPLLADSK